MRKLLDHKLAVFLIVGTIILSVIIGIFAARAAKEQASFAETMVESTMIPGQVGASGIGGWFRNFFGYFGSVKDLRAENELLKQENVDLDKRLRDIQGMEEENMELREMLDLTREETELDLVAASVVAKDPSNWYSTFTINKGSQDGIQKNQPVITGKKELVGLVYRVGPDWAEIMTVLDPESGVAAMVERSKDIGILEGDAALRYQGLCKMGYLSRDTDIEIDDYVETSGMGGIYPKGLLLGRVYDMMDEPSTMSKYAVIEPTVNFSKLSQVFVLRNDVDYIVRTPLSQYEKDEDEDESDNSKTGEDEEDDSDSEATSTPKSSATPSAKPTSTSTAKPTKTPTTAPTQAPVSAAPSTNQGGTLDAEGSGPVTGSGLELVE